MVTTVYNCGQKLEKKFSLSNETANQKIPSLKSNEFQLSFFLVFLLNLI